MNILKKLFFLFLIAVGLYACRPVESPQLVRVDGHDLLTPAGEKLLIKGTNLGNWLNPEGYMFGFSKANSARFINEMLCQLVGPDFAAE
ncbi:MAG: glycoside hydrolase family 5 protein, partial [Prevotellaceae bacterium]|nr:glycoside hydrolase family 5 protein [Prevotellaceae bacterium]